MNARRTFTFALGLAFLTALGLAPMPDADAQALRPVPCSTCIELNDKTGSGGPGFWDWSFACDDAGGSPTVFAKATTKGRPGPWTATLGSTTTVFEGSVNLSTPRGPAGSPIVRRLVDPAGKVWINTAQPFECDCDEPPVTPPPTTQPPVTVPPGGGPDVPPTTVAPPATVVGRLPSVGINAEGTALIAAAFIFVGMFTLIAATTKRER